MATTTRTTKRPTPQTKVTVKDGLATVFVHKDVSALSINDETFTRKNVSARTWSFQCDPALARELIDRYEFAAGAESGVPLTEDEKIVAEDLKSRSNVEVARMSAALAELAAERVSKNEG